MFDSAEMLPHQHFCARCVLGRESLDELGMFVNKTEMWRNRRALELGSSGNESIYQGKRGRHCPSIW